VHLYDATVGAYSTAIKRYFRVCHCKKSVSNRAIYAVKLLQSLRDFVADLRGSPTSFYDFEEQANLVAVVKSYRTVTRRKMPKSYADDV
jgi:hypothetical protein